MHGRSPTARLVRGIVGAVVLLLVLLRPADAQVEKQDPIVLVGILPLRDGKYDVRLLAEAQVIRKTIAAAIENKDRTVLGHDDLVALLGAGYLNAFIACKSDEACVVALLAPVKAKFTFAVYGDYEGPKDRYHLRLRVINLAVGKVVKTTDYRVAKNIIKAPARWLKSLQFAFASLLQGLTASTEPPPTDPPPTDPTDPPPTDPPPTDPSVGPVLEPITIGPDEESDQIDLAAVDEASRGAVLHGHFQQYIAVGIRGRGGISGSRGDFLIFDDTMQLDFEKQVGDFRLFGRPQFHYDWLTKQLDVRFREIYAATNFDKLELSFGQRILAWGITDFWPVVDLLNPRDFITLRNWRPIDEKLPAPMLRAVVTSGRLSLDVIAIPFVAPSSYQLDATQPFALPIPEGVALVQTPVENGHENIGGGARLKVSAGDRQLSVYALLGRDPLPAIALARDTFEISNERVAMGAVSFQGSIDSLDTIVKAEAAYYHRRDDSCDGRRAPPDELGFPGCSYLRRTPTARATFALERQILTGLDAHIQLIGEYTRAGDIDPLPPVIVSQSPRTERQPELNPIATLRLQGSYKKEDFRPMLFAYWSPVDKDVFVNLDLEYHIADGMALALGGFWFEGYAYKGKTDTLFGSLESVSHAYFRGTAWF